MDENIAIKVENLTKTYPIYDSKHERMKEALSLTRKKYHTDFHALKEVSFEIKKGETVGIIGQNGSGKSTLLKILTGVLSPTSGSVQVNGKVSALLELGAGFNPEMTGMENIYLNGTIMGYTKEEMDDRVPKIVEFADIGEFINQPVKMYSSGMFARLAFAVAINVEPEILIVDEALSVGDMRFQIKCMDHMKKMMEGGTTVLFVSHDINAIRRFCGQAIWINKGKIFQIGEVNLAADAYLDFLKSNSDEKNGSYIPVSAEDDKPFIPNGNIAKIIDFKILGELNQEVNTCNLDETIKIQVIYDVYDNSLESPVLGIALKDIDGDYICGLNTLLDSQDIPWEYGRNSFYLVYTKGLLSTSGTYVFDVALFDRTATVPIQYITAAKEIKIVSKYVGEGRVIIPHKWRE